MKRAFLLAKRNIKEIIRDPISLLFSLGLPVVMLIVMELIFMGLPNKEANMFKIEQYAPAICIFGFTFTMLNIGLSISGDKVSAFMSRVLVSPVKKGEYLFSYILSSIPVMYAQAILFYLIALIFGFKINGGFFLSFVTMFPAIILFSSLGLFIGAVANNEKQAGPISSMIISATGILGGVFMPINSTGDVFILICKILPFYNAVELTKYPICGAYSWWIPLLILIAYSLVFFILAVIIFNKKVKK